MLQHKVCEICWHGTLRVKMKYNAKCKNKRHSNQKKKCPPTIIVALFIKGIYEQQATQSFLQELANKHPDQLQLPWPGS